MINKLSFLVIAISLSILIYTFSKGFKQDFAGQTIIKPVYYERECEECPEPIQRYTEITDCGPSYYFEFTELNKEYQSLYEFMQGEGGLKEQLATCLEKL